MIFHMNHMKLYRHHCDKDLHPIIISIIIDIIIIDLFNDISYESYETIYETVILKINFTSYGDYCPKL